MESSFLIALAAALVVGPVMLIAGVLKTRQRGAFEASLQSYAFVPTSLRKPLSFAIPALEAALGVAVLTLQLPVLAGVATAILLLAFSTATVKAAGLSGTSDCGCFGPARASDVRVLLTRNAALIVLALIPASLALETPHGVAGSAAVIGVLALLLFARAQSDTATPMLETEPTDPGRRRILRGGFALGATMAASAAGILRSGGVAEAACAGCGSCANQYFFLHCTGPCCGLYFVRQRQNCDGGCYLCSGGWTQEFCGVPGCGC